MKMNLVSVFFWSDVIGDMHVPELHVISTKAISYPFTKYHHLTKITTKIKSRVELLSIVKNIFVNFIYFAILFLKIYMFVI